MTADALALIENERELRHTGIVTLAAANNQSEPEAYDSEAESCRA
jgi:hypothetical protein